MSNKEIAIAAGLLLLASAHKALTGSSVQALQTKITGVDTKSNVAANGYDQTPPAQVPSKPSPMPIALAASGLPTVNPLVDLTPNEVIRGGQYSSLIKNTGQSYDFRGVIIVCLLSISMFHHALYSFDRPVNGSVMRVPH